MCVRLCLCLVLCVTCVTSVCRIYGNQAICHLRDVWHYHGSPWQKLTVINLGRADQHYFGPWVFRHIPHLNQFVIQNSADFGRPNMFRNLHVEQINFSNNFLPEIPVHMFVDCTVRQLVLNRNHIRTLRPGCFRNLPSLVYLSMQENHLKTLPRGVFNKLDIKELLLSKNEISDIKYGAFFNMHSLSALQLDHNHLHKFKSRSLLGRGTNLQMLDLSNNLIKKVDKLMFDVLSNLRILNLDNNKIDMIQHGAFNSLRQVRNIRLQNNHLRHLSCFVMPPSGLYNLVELNIASNKIQHLSSQFLDRLRTVKQFCAGKNPLHCATENRIIEWTSLKNTHCGNPSYNLKKRWCGHKFHHHHHHHHPYHHFHNADESYEHLVDLRFGSVEETNNNTQEASNSEDPITSAESDKFGETNQTSVELESSESLESNETSSETFFVPTLLNRFHSDEVDFDYDDFIENYINKNNTDNESEATYNFTENYQQNYTTTDDIISVSNFTLNVSENVSTTDDTFSTSNLTLNVSENFVHNYATTEDTSTATDTKFSSYNLFRNATENVEENTTENITQLLVVENKIEELSTTTEKNNVEDQVPVISFGFGFYDE